MAHDNKLVWRKSSFSQSPTNECVEVAWPRTSVAVRDSKQGEYGPTLGFGAAQWRRFVQAATKG
nr:DUF397 domain-containing protein [Actinokineospora enzanensis]